MIILMWLLVTYVVSNVVLACLSWSEDVQWRTRLGLEHPPLWTELATVFVAAFVFIPYIVLNENTSLRRRLRRNVHVPAAVTIVVVAVLLMLMWVGSAKADDPPGEVIPGYRLVYVDTVLPHTVCFMLVNTETGEPEQMSCTMAPPAPIIEPEQRENDRWTPTAATIRQW